MAMQHVHVHVHVYMLPRVEKLSGLPQSNRAGTVPRGST